LRVVLIGNFDAVFCSESHYAWTFENKLGWQVTRMQENRTSASEVIGQCKGVDCVFWVHTHGWQIPEEHRIREYVMENNIPSFSYHLDKYFGIPDREGSYLAHPSFHLRRFFSTDGNNDDGWKKYGINHEWILPGCVEYGCYLGNHRGGFDIPVLFAGSVGYHSEYPFRPALVQGLSNHYGNRFQVVQGIREAELNNLYNSSRVVIGDHIFSGQPRYCSDRLFETLGRGGFIIYPRTEGITEELEKYGLVVYEPQNIDDLIKKTDYYLADEHQKERIERRNTLFEHVKNNHTYTHRLRQILQIMGLE
jgi:hypothetical protein